MFSLAIPSSNIKTDIDTKTAVDSQPTSSTIAPALGVFSLQFSYIFESLNFVELHQENDGSFFLRGIDGKGVSKKLTLPNHDNTLILHYSIRTNAQEKKILRIEKRKLELEASQKMDPNNTISNTGEIHFQKARIISFTDSAAALMPQDNSYILNRVMSLLDFYKVGLPLNKLRLYSHLKEKQALNAALANIAKLQAENTASTISTITNASTAPTTAAASLTWMNLPYSTATFTEFTDTVLTSGATTQPPVLRRTPASTATTSTNATMLGHTTTPTNNLPNNTVTAPLPITLAPQAIEQHRAALTAAQLADGLNRVGVDLDESLSKSDSNPITIRDMDGEEGGCCSWLLRPT